jgi:hypothetical protein
MNELPEQIIRSTYAESERARFPFWTRIRKTEDVYWVALLAIFMSISSYIFFYKHGLLVVAGDMATHLNLARRVFDNLTPGLGNLGGYWLPLLHLLELPLVWNDYLWRTGLAGAVVSMVAFVVTAVYLHQLALLLIEDRRSAWIASLIFITNPIMLFLQSVPMFESLVIATVVMATYYLAQWALARRGNSSLVVASLVMSMAVLVRYENWAALLIMLLFTFVTLAKRYSSRTAIEAHLLTFTVPPAYTVFLFIFVFNWLIEGNPFHFLQPSFREALNTSPVEMVTSISFNQVITALQRYVLAAAHNSGFILFILFLLGLALFIWKERLSVRAVLAYTLLSPFLFFWLMLSIRPAQGPIIVPELPPFVEGASWAYSNVRYGVIALPAIAIFSAYLTKGRNWTKVTALAMIVLQVAIFTRGEAFFASYAPELNANLSLNGEDWDTIDWLSENYDGGLILMSTYKARNYTMHGDTIIIHSGLYNREFIHEGTQDYWSDSLMNPSKYAAWILAKDGDRIHSLMQRRPDLFWSYELVYKSPESIYQIYHLTN